MQVESPFTTKNNLNVFKRRTAVNVSAKTLRDWQDKQNTKKFKKVNCKKQNQGDSQFFAKFQQSPLNESLAQSEKPINLFKQQKKFEKIIENIEPRGGSFYRFGFKSHEKANKRLFAEVLNVVPSRMKGTMHIGEMWSTIQTAKFMKENKIFINKLKLMDKLKNAKQKQEKEVMQSTNSLFPSNESKNSFGSRYRLSQINTVGRLSATEISNNSFKQLNRSIQQIHKQLKNLKPFVSTERDLGKLKQMEECIQKINEIDSSYHEKIGEWI